METQLKTDIHKLPLKNSKELFEAIRIPNVPKILW